MSEIDFQNGFLCGMATRGLSKSGNGYVPACWNDTGVYSYFYIDFRRVMSAFSLGMFNESIIVYDTEQIPVTGVTAVSPGLYKVHCDISSHKYGVMVINKVSSYLNFVNSAVVPAFAVRMLIDGQPIYFRMPYMYEIFNYTGCWASSITESSLISMFSMISVDAVYESTVYTTPESTITEATDITFF